MYFVKVGTFAREATGDLKTKPYRAVLLQSLLIVNVLELWSPFCSIIVHNTSAVKFVCSICTTSYKVPSDSPFVLEVSWLFHSIMNTAANRGSLCGQKCGTKFRLRLSVFVCIEDRQWLFHCGVK